MRGGGFEGSILGRKEGGECGADRLDDASVAAGYCGRLGNW